MKRRIIPIFIISIVLCLIITSSIASAQDFEYISEPPDDTIKVNDDYSITWTVSISSVTDPTYSVFVNEVVLIDEWEWIFGGGMGTIQIHVNSSRAGAYAYRIEVFDGAGHEISDEVIITVEERTKLGLWLKEGGWIYIISGIVLVGFMTAMVFMRRRGFKKSQSMIS